jgi:aminoglycoside 2'-N-acetyltransferase I
VFGSPLGQTAAVAAEVRVVRTDELGPELLVVLRALMLIAFEDRLTEDDWANTLGGRHAVVTVDGVVVAHAALVERMLVAGERPLRTGYVEGVATTPNQQHRGHGSLAMRALQERITTEYELGGLSTGAHPFYERLGWERWRGRTFVDGPNGRAPTPDDDDGVMVLRTERTPDLDLTADLVCDWRSGDVW